MPASPQPFPPIPTEALDRKLRWRVLPILGFGGLMLGLGTVAAISWLAPPRSLVGLPDDADVSAAIAHLAAAPLPQDGALAFRSALTGAIALDGATPPPGAALAAALDQADAALARAQRRHRFDARLIAARAHVELLRGRYMHASRLYELTLTLPGDLPEAHLGYGVALGALAERDADDPGRVQFWLRAAAQFAAVRGDDALERLARADRAIALRRAGHADEPGAR